MALEGKYVWMADMLLCMSCGVQRISSIVTFRCVHFGACILHNVCSGLSHFKAVTLKFHSSCFAVRLAVGCYFYLSTQTISFLAD
jgi:hypothetical protein